jgi:hypothetical protein
MSRKCRSWSVEQKFQLIREVDQYGLPETLRKHNVE